MLSGEGRIPEVKEPLSEQNSQKTDNKTRTNVRLKDGYHYVVMSGRYYIK